MARGTTIRKDDKIILRCSPEFKEELKKAATEADIEVAAFVREAIKEKIERMGKYKKIK